MRLSNLSTIFREGQIDILVEDGRIDSVSEHEDSPVVHKNKVALKFDNAIIFPGLINSHDHLDFNSFPQLGNRVYTNYVEWGEDIHHQNKETIDQVLKIPRQLRIQWGIYKNLLNGITTVVNHGPALPIEDDLINIWQESHSLHSVQLEKKWKYKLNWPFGNKHPFAIHIGEGTDKAAREEIDTLLKWNLFNRELVGIHAVAMNEEQATKFKAIVWCPDSNCFLLGKTADIGKLKQHTHILFGTDSTVSSNWNLWDHLRLAREQKMVSDVELFNMLTKTPADVWNMPGSGSIAKGSSADIVIGKMKSGLNSIDTFYALNPEDILMVLSKGNIRLFDESLYQKLSDQKVELQNFYKIYINSSCKYIYGNLPALVKSIREYYPEAHFPITV
jgi:cytosine/adenosine deaminase-related metal-dependent hydrolase